MNEERLRTHELNNLIQSALLLGCMAAVLALLGWLLGSGSSVIWAAVTGIMVLVLSPRASPRLMPKLHGAQALSRTREFDADVEAAELTDDPLGLASALHKLYRYQGGLLRRILMPDGRKPDSWILSTHPSSQERIRRLTELAETWPRPIEALALVENPFDVSDERLALRRLPWWYLSRLGQ